MDRLDANSFASWTYHQLLTFIPVHSPEALEIDTDLKDDHASEKPGN